MNKIKQKQGRENRRTTSNVTNNYNNYPSEISSTKLPSIKPKTLTAKRKKKKIDNSSRISYAQILAM